jgi:hypothetical protein
MINQKANDWLKHGNRGVSSETILSVMEGINVAQYFCHPYDPSDFFRCCLLLEAVPEYRARLNEMAVVSKEWAILVEHWGELESLLETERNTVSALKTYEKMKRLLKEAKEREK